MLCAACRCIGLDADGLNGLLTENFNFHLKDSYSSLKQSAEAGCDCCLLVMESLESSERDNTKRGGPITIRREGNVMSVRPPYIDDITVHIGGEQDRPQLRIFTTDGMVYLFLRTKQLTKRRGQCSRRLSTDWTKGDAHSRESNTMAQEAPSRLRVKSY